MRTGASFSFKAVGDRHLTVLGAFRPCARPRIVSAHDLGGLDQAGRNELGHGIRSLMGTSTLRRHALLNTKSIIDVAQRSLLSTRAKMTGYFPSSPSESTQTQSPEELIREATSLKHQCEMVPVGKLTSRDAVDILSTITELHWTYMPLLNLQPQLELQNGNITHGFDGDTSVPGQWFAASSKDGEAAAVLASSLLHRLIDDNVAGQNPAAHPGNTNICDMVIALWGACRVTDSGPQAQVILDRLLECYQGDIEMQPGTKTFAKTIGAWFNSIPSSWIPSTLHKEAEDNLRIGLASAQGAQKILDLMESFAHSGSMYVKPTPRCYHLVLCSWSRLGSVVPGSSDGLHAATMADAALSRMIAIAESENDPMYVPWPKCFKNVIMLWIRTRAVRCAEHAEVLIDKMEAMQLRFGNELVEHKLDVPTVASAINAFGQVRNIRRVEALWRRVETGFYDSTSIFPSPDVTIYNAVLFWLSQNAKSDLEMATKAEAILERMEANRVLGEGPSPTTYSYLTVIQTLAEAKGDGVVARIAQLFQSMQLHEPESVGNKAYTSVIHSLAKIGSSEALRLAETLLNNLMDRYRGTRDSNLKPDCVTFTALINAYALSRERGAALKAEAVLKWMMKLKHNNIIDEAPDTITFTAVIDAWARSWDVTAGDRAEQIANHMEVLSRSGVANCKPNKYTLTTVMCALAKSESKGNARRAAAIFDRMCVLYKKGDTSMMPDAAAANAVVSAFARSKEYGSAKRAQDFLDRIEETCKLDHRLTKLNPNTSTYRYAIEAWTRSADTNGPQFALKIIDKMEKLQRSGSKEVVLTTYMYNLVIDAYAKSDIFGKSRCVWSILERMKKNFEEGALDAKPDVQTYCCIINACSFSRQEVDRKASLEIALRAFADMNDSLIGVKANSYVYANLLKAFANLMDDGEERNMAAKYVFQLCCESGQVTGAVVNNLAHAAPVVWAAVIPHQVDYNGKSIASFGKLPASWSRNVRVKQP